MHLAHTAVKLQITGRRNREAYGKKLLSNEHRLLGISD